VQVTAIEIAERLAASSASAIRFTKHALNHWLRAALPAFEHSLALEMLGFLGADAREGVAALRGKRRPVFPSVAGPAASAAESPLASDGGAPDQAGGGSTVTRVPSGS
jgi:hypothetical protein